MPTSEIRQIPEVAALDGRESWVRIPPEVDVPLTARVRRILDASEFRRLARISQLGLVGLVYPAALHTRFEHSLGVYRLALLYLRHLSHDQRFSAVIGPGDAELFVLAALLHDLGHWPFCHPIEDIRLEGVPRHEAFASRILLESDLADLLRQDWNIAPEQLLSLLAEKQHDVRGRILSSMLSGPIDIDKMDYLARDSLHAGVPYGRNFDQQRLIGSLCLNEQGDGLAITEKGKTAAEMMVFARYVMFSEVYWHHTVRSATAMLQRAFYLLHARLDLNSLFRLAESPMIVELQEAARGSAAGELLQGLFGSTRCLYKRVAQYSYFEDSELYQSLARRPYTWLAKCAENIASWATRSLGQRVAPHEVLLDAPPVQREVEFNIEIYYPKHDRYRTLGDVSPVVRTLAQRQFDDYVKRVRLFAHPRVAADLRGLSNLHDLVRQAVADTD